MKSFFTLLFTVANISILSAQWSNSNNLFYDSLHMPVCTVAGTQQHPVVIRSFPDSSYFVIWEDQRNAGTTKEDIYAQKYDKAGNRLWAVDGLPVVNGPNDQHYTWSSNEDYRNRRYAASDSAGGFYIAYADDSISQFDWQRICVQHIRANGSQVFPGAGFIIAQTPTDSTYFFSEPQLISDEAGGVYISYMKSTDNDYLYITNYKEQGGTLQLQGEGLMNQNAVQNLLPTPCPATNQQVVIYPSTRVSDYNIWPDLQGGCSIIMSMNGNTASQGKIVGYNRLWKAKKDAQVSIATVFPDGNPNVAHITYHKGDLDILYKIKILNLDKSCGSGAQTFYSDAELISTGYLPLDIGAVEYLYPKGVTVASGGNINVELLASEKRNFTGTGVTIPTLESFAFASEIFDSIPYQRASSNNPEVGYNTVPPAQMNKLTHFVDTLLSSGTSYSDFSLTGGGTELYAAALMVETGHPSRSVRLQHLHIEQVTTDSFALQFTGGSNKGELIGKELNQVASNASLQFDFPMITADNSGNALFSIVESQQIIRVSPIGNVAQLTWGAMGKPIGTTFSNGSPYNSVNSSVALDPVRGTGVISWEDNRNTQLGTGINIYMRHLDSLNVVDYTPANKKIQVLPAGSTTANAIVLTGTSHHFTTIEAVNGFTGTTSPVVELSDNYDLGYAQVNVFENTGPVRFYNGKAYLDRNYTIKPENNPAGAATVNVRLFFTDAAFNALKAADASITGPASLGVIKQPNSGGIVPSAYTPVAGEEIISQTAWKQVDGGYYIEIPVSSFSNFFIEQVNMALPVTWLDITAKRTAEGRATITWEVADELNVKDYTVQFSNNGADFTDACTVRAAGLSAYHCEVVADNNKKYYFRVMQHDFDGHSSISKIVVLQATGNETLIILSPDPASSYTLVHNNNNKVFLHSVALLNMDGKIIWSDRAISGNDYRVPLSSVRAGMYFVRVVLSDDMIITRKLIKQ